MRCAAIVILTLLLAACSAARDELPPLTETPAGPYQLDAGDRVRLTVFGQDNLSGEYTVSDTGVVALPLLGPVEARGRTIQDFAAAVATALQAGGFMLEPRVSTEVVEFRPFYILGEVQNPGRYDYAPGMNVLTAVATSGGFTYRADTDDVTIVRQIEGRTVEGRARRSTPILPGDAIYVHERFF